MIRKVASYIFREGPRQNELLVFAHRDMPDVPIQVPGGTVDAGEKIVAALFREIEEEAGLTDLTLIRNLGAYQFYWEEIESDVERHFFLLQAPSHTRDQWDHEVFGKGEDKGLVFSYSWLELNSSPGLAGDLEKFLNREATPELFAL